MTTLRDQIISQPDLAYEDVVLPEWGGVTVRVREMTALARVEWDEATLAIGDKEPRLRTIARFLDACLRDPADDGPLALGVDALLQRNARTLVRLFEVAVRVNSTEEAPGGMSPKD